MGDSYVISKSFWQYFLPRFYAGYHPRTHIEIFPSMLAGVVVIELFHGTICRDHDGIE